MTVRKDRQSQRTQSKLRSPGASTSASKSAPGSNRDRLRISYLLQQFPLPTETFAVSDVGELLAQGHEVTVYTMKRARRNEAVHLTHSAVPEQLRIARPTWSGGRRWPVLLWRNRKLCASLTGRIVRRGGRTPVTAVQALLCVPRIVEIADAIGRDGSDVAHAFWSRHVGLVLDALKMRGAPAVRTAFVGAYDLVADDFLVEMTLDAAEAVFSHAEVNRPYLQAKAPAEAEIEIVRRGIPLPQLGGTRHRDPFRWVTASSLIPAKNVGAVIRSFAAARRLEPRLTLRIFGEGPERSRLEKIAAELACSDSVEFAGHVRRDALFSELESSSVFLLLSKGEWERLPNVLKEALWAGCAVIASRTPGIEELIPGAAIGQVVDPDDNAAITAAVAAVLTESAGEAAERRRQARAHVAEHFSSGRSMRRYVRIWQRLRGSARQG